MSMTDLRFSLRFLRTSPGFAATAIVTLAVAIAVNTTCLALLNNLGFRLIPAADPEGLVRVYPVDRTGRRNSIVSYPDYRELRDRGTLLSDLAGYVPTMVTVRSATASGDLAQPRDMLAYVISANYFSILGAHPMVGRTIRPEEDQVADTHAVALISHRLWQRLGGSDEALKSGLIVNGRLFSIIGVMPSTFVGTEPLVPDLWVPLSMQARVVPGLDLLHLADEPWLLLLGRVRAESTRGSAEQQLSSLLRDASGPRPAESQPSGVSLRRASFFTVDRDPAEVAALMLIATILLLAVASANVANLMLARALSRQREIAVRLALGASLPRLVRMLFAEGAWVAVLSGGLALLLSSWALSIIYGLALERSPFELGTVLFDLSPDWRVFGGTSVLCGLVAVLVGLAPALQARRVQVIEALHGAVSMFGARVSQSRARAILINAQVAISVALIIAAGLLSRAALRAEGLDIGFSPRNVLTTDYDLKRYQFPPSRSAAFVRTMVERARHLPGVVSATAGSHVALTGGLRVTTVWIPEKGKETVQHSRYVLVGSDYFRTLGIPVVRGRDVNVRNGLAGRSEAVISEVLAGQLWPNADPLGKQIQTGLSKVDYTVVGVARDTEASSLWRDKEQAVYLTPTTDQEVARTRAIVLVSGSLEGTRQELRRLANQLEPDVAFDVSELEKTVALWLLPSRGAAVMGATIGVLALLIAAFGAYGVMSHVLGRQKREFAIRHALGADTGRLVRFGVGQGMVLVLPGLAVGILGGALVGRTISSFLFGLSAADPLAYVTATSVVLLTCVLACYLPVRHIAYGDPIEALRVE
jgi:putative ABC transport system permease protein